MGAWVNDFGPGDSGLARKALIAESLDPGERIVWQGGPIRSALIRRAIPKALFGLLWTAFVVTWMAMVAQRGLGKPAPGKVVEPFSRGNVAIAAMAGLWLLPFGIYTSARPLLEGRKAGRTAYALTDRRALVVEPGLFGHVRSRGYSPERLALMACNEQADGAGDLVFENRADWSGSRPIGFLAIDRVREVEALARKTLHLEGPGRERPTVAPSRIVVEPATYRAGADTYLARIICSIIGGITSYCLMANGVVFLGFFLSAPQKAIAILQEAAAAKGWAGPLGLACAMAVGSGTAIILGLAACLSIRFALVMPTKIAVASDGLISFHGWRRTLELRPEDIRSIKTGAWYDPNHSQVTVRYAGGKLIFFSQFPNFRDFLARLKALNPTVEIRGF
jgi:hypothetical protein